VVDIPQGTCSIKGCDERHRARGWCEKHYTSWRRYGNPEQRLRVVYGPAEKRFWLKVDKTETCWLWTGSTNADGYGQFWDGRRMVKAHRFAYQSLVGPPPKGRELDHLCHNADRSCLGGTDCPHRCCVNPAHLEPVTNPENTRRGQGFGGRNARKTHCPQGHPYDEANTYIKPGDGGRMCRICYQARNQRRSAARQRGES